MDYRPAVRKALVGHNGKLQDVVAQDVAVALIEAGCNFSVNILRPYVRTAIRNRKAKGTTVEILIERIMGRIDAFLHVRSSLTALPSEFTDSGDPPEPGPDPDEVPADAEVTEMPTTS